MKKILHVVSVLDAGGVENLLLNYSLTGPICENFEIDFITHSESGVVHSILEDRGFNIFYATPKKKSLIQNVLDVARVIRKGHYQIVHVHQNDMSFIPLFLAKCYGVPVRIVHSHSNKSNCEHGVMRLLKKITKFLSIVFATDFWACGQAAGEYLYGHKKDFYIMPNAISGNNFMLAKLVNKKDIYDKIGVTENEIIISQIGRFTYEKNHDFTVKIIEKLAKSDLNFIFIFAGDGPLKSKIQEKIITLGLSPRCKFLGNINYVSELLSVSSVTLLPSIFEGFPVTVVESLFLGTPIICSDNVSNEVELFHLCKRCPCNIDTWIDNIKISINTDEDEKNACSKFMLESNYEINNARNLIYDKYVSLLNGKINKDTK